jgi:hypothetical protein
MAIEVTLLEAEIKASCGARWSASLPGCVEGRPGTHVPLGTLHLLWLQGGQGRSGQVELPLLPGPMAGEAKSLVIENVNKGCKEMAHYKQIGGHEEVCSYRLVLCPSTVHICGKLISFRYVEQHIKQCPGKTGRLPSDLVTQP